MRSCEIKNRIADLKKTTAELEILLAELKHGRDDLETELQALHAMWSGEECDRFAERSRFDLEALEEQIRTTEKNLKYLRHAAESYRACEKAAAEIIEGV